ncbi:MAG TPA: imelysin family protein, partial [Polyangiaceae bacterium]
MRVPGLLAIGLLLSSAAGCRSEGHAGADEPTSRQGSKVSAAELAALRPALTTYADIAHAAYADAAGGARALLGAVNALLAAPSAESLTNARKAWLAARRPYQQTEFLRFYDGPIDATELLINTWPIDESYVEAGVADGRKGILDDKTKYPELSRTLLSSLNAQEGETSISTGYHVIEFLLWGQDTDPNGPGNRAHTDFDAKVSPLADRRGRYLQLATELLIGELDQLAQAWAAGSENNYRARFLNMPPLEAFGLAIKGMGTLSGPELSGERLTVAYETKDQENEHSCFSDNTAQDLVDDALGLENVCSGRYQRADGSVLAGTGLCSAIGVRDRALGERLEREMKESTLALR